METKTEQRRDRKCDAKTRRCTPRQRSAITKWTLQLHGGLSTGPKTREGRLRIRLALLKHGR